MKRLLLTLSAASALSLTMVAQDSGKRTITGTVIYAGDDQPLIGATVMPVGQGTGVATDIDGHFSITVGPDVKKINVSYVGMVTRQFSIDGNKPLEIKLSNSDNTLDEVVVTDRKSVV